MNNVEIALNELVNYLNNTELFKEYKRLSSAFANNKKLLQIQKDLVDLETRFRNGEDVVSEMKTLKNTYETDPLVINYKRVKEDVNLLLDEIKRIID
jgi:cell fate (sporulation/competence/biofilm development) regulator YmcA (YheA/YmcA/DUF963 family)